MKATVAPWDRIVYCVRIEPEFGDAVRLTDYPTDLQMAGGQLYLSGSGYQMADLSTDSSMSGSSVDLEGILGLAGVSRERLAAGDFDHARYYVFATDWSAPVEDHEQVSAGVFGRVKLVADRYTVELMSLIDLLSQSVGETYEPRCMRSFGQLAGRVIKRCGVDLEALRVTGSVGSVSGRASFTDPARSEPDDWFAYGLLTWLTGSNAGRRPAQVKVHAAGGAIELFEPPPAAIQPGDTYSMTPGCRKRLQDCRDKYANVVNFGGFPNLPTVKQSSQWGKP